METKIVYINGRFLTQKITGVQRYAIELLKELDKKIGELSRKKYKVILFTPKKNIINNVEFNSIEIRKIGLLSGHLWEQLELPFYCRKGILINLCNVSPLLKRNQIITIHDIAIYTPYNNLSFLFKLWYKMNYSIFNSRFLKIITVSNYSASEMLKYGLFEENKIEVTVEGREHILSLKPDNSVLKKHSIGNKPYFLAVSSMNPNKNFIGIVNALNNIKDNHVDVVIVGGTNNKVFKNENINFPSNVKKIGYINDNELKSLYENALGFLYPSLYEGFGLPPLEAMALGCPVIVSNRSSLPEVCGDAALYCDPKDSVDISDKMKLLINDTDLRLSLEKKGLERSKLYSWAKAAEQTLDIIKGIY